MFNTIIRAIHVLQILAVQYVLIRIAIRIAKRIAHGRIRRAVTGAFPHPALRNMTFVPAATQPPAFGNRP